MSIKRVNLPDPPNSIFSYLYRLKKPDASFDPPPPFNHLTRLAKTSKKKLFLNRVPFKFNSRCSVGPPIRLISWRRICFRIEVISPMSLFLRVSGFYQYQKYSFCISNSFWGEGRSVGNYRRPETLNISSLNIRHWILDKKLVLLHWTFSTLL